MADSDGSDAYTLHPRLPDTARPLHDRLREGLRRCRRQDLCQQDLMRTLLADDALTDLPEPDRLATRLFFEVLEDLARHGWQFDPGVCPGTNEEDLDGEKLCAIPPVATTGSGRDHQEVKRRLRRMLVEARDEQLQQPSVRRFVEKMERPRWHRGKQVSVQDLFADPQTFSSDLERCLDADSAGLREELVRDLVDPYLQRVTDERDAFTGLRLRDVWRYCRYTWSLPQKTQPGRRMSYLVRDAARPFDPIMGIGALGSSIMQISCRDEKVGWSFEALRETNVPAAQMRALRDELDRSVAEIYRADFEEEGLLDTEAVEHPSPETLDALAPLADEKPPSDGRIDREVPLEEAARRPLFRHKRAKTLRTLLRTRMTFQHAAAEADGDGDDAQFEQLLATKGGRRALKAAMRSQKKRHVGSSMMNITTCGALPPYNPVLGGKLAGLLMVSPQVLADYREKYGGHASYIASRMKGAPLERRNELALLETTSLYGVGSSQYNRLRAPVAHGEVRYEEVGQTDGYGSVHLSERTYRTLQTLLEEHPDLNPESHEFGRGVNYKMRSLAAALRHLGMQKVQQHKNPRLVYAIPLATNWKAYLTGRDEEPRLLYDDLERPGAETRALVDFWKRRWFIDRVQKPAIRQRLREQHGPVRVSRHIEERDASAAPSRPSAPAAPSANGTSFMPADQTLHWTKLAELTGGGASFAEHLTDAEMAALHVPTQLDEGLLAAVEAGKRVYLTGNPGDGKTFVIRFYRERLDAEGAFLNTDASATGETDLAAELTKAIREERPAVVAVNEGPLRLLKNRLPESERNALAEQLDQPFLYRDDPSIDENPDALLVNLDLRQVLDPDILDGVVNMVLNRVDYEGAPESVKHNHDMLKRDRVRERLKALMKRVAQSGRHVIMRHLLSFFSYIITGGATSPEAASDVDPYYQAAFDSKNALDELLRPFDPSQLSHSLIDAQLWDGRGNGQIEWLETPKEPVPLECDDSEEAETVFKKWKRRFFFEADSGDALLRMIPEDRQQFYDLLDSAKDTRGTATQDLLRTLSQFFGGSTDDNEDARLPVWTGLRYRADGPPTALVAGQHLERKDVTLRAPRLREGIAELMEYTPNHLRLQFEPRTGAPVGLRIDLPLWFEVMKVDRGMPPRLRSPLIERRLERFLAQVATLRQSDDQDFAQLSVRDVENGKTYPIRVLLDQKKYRL